MKQWALAVRVGADGRRGVVRLRVGRVRGFEVARRARDTQRKMAAGVMAFVERRS